MSVSLDGCIAEQTTKTHVGRILMKLALRDRAQVVVFAYESAAGAGEPLPPDPLDIEFGGLGEQSNSRSAALRGSSEPATRIMVVFIAFPPSKAGSPA